MKELFIVIILCFSLLNVESSRNYLRLTRPIVESQEYSDEQLKVIFEKLKPRLDGDTPGTIPQPASAGSLKIRKNPNINKHIVSGSVASIGQFPWQVALDIDGESFCGGSAISETYVLTAAHCTEKARTVTASFGAHNVDAYEKDRQTMTARKKIIHENWSFDTVQNDISLLLMPGKIKFNKLVQLVRLPTKIHAEQHFVNTNVVISGWGKKSDDAADISSVLNFVPMKVTSMMDCLRAYGSSSVFRTSLCVKGDRSKATCQGDSGGPLVLKEDDGLYTQLGIVSFGASDGCGKGYPDVFTRVPSYLGWISTNTRIAIKPDRPIKSADSKPATSGKSKGKQTTPSKKI